MNTFTILYEDADMLAIDKPAGVLVHGDMSNEPSVSDWFARAYPDSIDVGEPATLPNGKVVPRPGIVHRLDRDTSGVLVIAKTKEAYEFLKREFQERNIQKIYRLFVYGEMKESDGVINRPIGKSASDFRKWSAQRGARGELREAVTEYKTLYAGKDVSYVEAYPKTGRTHQIRVHFKAIHHPLVHDDLYAPNHHALLGFKRLALHAYSLSCTAPRGEKVSIQAPFPQDFIDAMNAIGISAL